MLGVLLAAARPGQRRPGAAQALNLVTCGLAIRARRTLDAGPWQDALAVVSLIIPVLTLVISTLEFALPAGGGPRRRSRACRWRWTWPFC